MLPRTLTRLKVIVASFVYALHSVQAAPSVVSTSEATTEGERKLLEPDLNRTFKPESARFGSRSASDVKGAQSATYNQTKEFGSSKEFAAKQFAASEFLPSKNTAENKTFVPKQSGTPTQSFLTTKEAVPVKPFSANQSSLEEKTFSSRAAKDASQSYAGQEAEKMKEQFTPSSQPRGGVSTGRRLSVEEVKEILNKSK